MAGRLGLGWVGATFRIGPDADSINMRGLFQSGAVPGALAPCEPSEHLEGTIVG